MLIRGDDPPLAGAGMTGERTVSGLANYPNPFNPTTEISFSLPSAADVKLEIFNVMGQKVSTIVDGTLDAGDHTFEWDGSNVASGVYFYRIETGNIVQTKKMVLMK